MTGFKAVKRFFWDKGIFDNTLVYFRRKNLDGELIWLVASVVSLTDKPVPGYILKESVVEDEETALKLNRLIRVMALLAKSVDDAFTYRENENAANDDSSPNQSIGNTNGANPNNSSSCHDPEIADDLRLLESLLEKEDGTNKDYLQNLFKSFGGTVVSAESSSGVTSDNEDNFTEPKCAGQSVPRRNSRIDTTPSILETVPRPSADISKIDLSIEEIMLISLVVSGKLTIYQIADLIFDGHSQISDAGQILEKFMIPIQSKQARKASSKRPKTPSINSGTQSNSYPSLSYDYMDTLNKPKESLYPSLGLDLCLAPPLKSLNLSFSTIGNKGMDILSEALYSNTPKLKFLDISFCQVHEKGILSLSRALMKRRKKGMTSLQGLILTGNTITYRAAKDLGIALCHKPNKYRQRISTTGIDVPKEGYMTDDEEDDEPFDEEDDELQQTKSSGLKRRHSSGLPRKQITKKEKVSDSDNKSSVEDPGIQLIHLASASLKTESILQILSGLGNASRLKEIDISSNMLGLEGITPFTDLLEGRGHQAMPLLDRLNVSNNQIGDDGLAKITRAIAKRRQKSIVDLHLSFNDIGPGGTGTLMNKLLSQNVVTLSLDNNLLGDAGCQLVAASLTSMHHLSRLDLSFNQIGSRGVNALMRALIGCESLTFLGLSGNVMKISGAIAMGFALAQHPRLSHVELYNCCLSQVAQCHIVAGIISNRWVPLQVVNGFRVGPPMAAIGALDPVGQHLGNAECLTIRRNVQMKAMLEFIRASKNKEGCVDIVQTTETNYNDFQSLDFVTPDSSKNNAPSQNSFMRMLEWLNRIPFDEEELRSLRRYFYDADDGSPDGLRGSDGGINLKYRGDLLAALGSGGIKEMNDDEIQVEFQSCPSVGLNIDESEESLIEESENVIINSDRHDTSHLTYRETSPSSCSSKTSMQSKNNPDIGSISSIQSQRSCDSATKSSKCNARITMFPKFFEKLDLLKSNAQELMNNEVDPARQDLIAQQFAEASLILLRQLRYQCMSSGLDGWRHGKIRRKVLIVDDSLVTRKLVGRAFEKANFIVDTAENGEEGVRMMKESVYDIAFMDIDMPVMNGFDATKALREWEDSKRPGARQPICALTATYVDDFQVHELMKFKEAGLDVMESKPCNIPRLFKVVDDVSPLFSDLTISVTKQAHSSTSLIHLGGSYD